MTHAAAAGAASDSPLNSTAPESTAPETHSTTPDNSTSDNNSHTAAHGDPHGADGGAVQGDGFTLWAVLRRDPRRPLELSESGVELAVSELTSVIADIESEGVTLRGIYDVSGFKAEDDLMFWLHGPVPEQLQSALRRLRRTTLLRDLLPTWNGMGVHRDAEFNKAHVPAFIRGVPPKQWMTVYPFVRSYEWYLLPDAERSRMLAQHGRKGAEYHSVLANTVSAFALGDYEWLLPLESDKLVDLVDMMRHLRSADARRHVREEVPFHTGRRIPVSEIPEVLQ